MSETLGQENIQKKFSWMKFERPWRAYSTVVGGFIYLLVNQRYI